MIFGNYGLYWSDQFYPSSPTITAPLSGSSKPNVLFDASLIDLSGSERYFVPNLIFFSCRGTLY